jgi:general secretion pathway protein I
VTARCRQQGFTLIEILVAFMILALALTVIFRIFSGGLRNVELSADYTLAALVAESQLAEAGVTAPLEPGETRGEWDDSFSWQRIIEPYLPWEEEKELSTAVEGYRITVNVDWERAGKKRRLTLSSIRLRKTDANGTAG